MSLYKYKYPRPMVTVDCIIYTEDKNQKQILLIKRKNEPYKDKWALPGGFVDMDEELEDAAIRELFEETNIKCKNLSQFKTYGTLGRDPRGRTISIVFSEKISENDKKLAVAGDDASETKWFDINEIKSLAFDHLKIIKEFFNK